MSEHAGNLRVLAGGTDLIPSMRQKLFEPQYVLDLRGIASHARDQAAARRRCRDRRADYACVRSSAQNFCASIILC